MYDIYITQFVFVYVQPLYIVNLYNYIYILNALRDFY